MMPYVDEFRPVHSLDALSDWPAPLQARHPRRMIHAAG